LQYWQHLPLSFFNTAETGFDCICCCERHPELVSGSRTAIKTMDLEMSSG
jgi:hypothetical protein